MHVTLGFADLSRSTDAPLSHLIIRTRDLNPALAACEAPNPKVRAVVDHVGYTVAGFERKKANAELKSLASKIVRAGCLHSLHMTDRFGYDMQVSGFANDTLTDGWRNRLGASVRAPPTLSRAVLRVAPRMHHAGSRTQ